MCEFVGLDMEMAFHVHYNEVIAVLHDVFTHIFDGLETTYAAELAAVRAQYPSARPRWTSEPCIIHWEEANAMLTAAGEDAPGLEDLSTTQERALGRLVAEQARGPARPTAPCLARKILTPVCEGGSVCSLAAVRHRLLLP